MNFKSNFVMSFLHGMLALLLAAASTAVYAQANAIEAINVSPAAGGKVVVKVTLKQAAGQPHPPVSPSTTPRASRSISPIPPTRSAATRQEVGEGDLRSMNMVQAGDRTRLVLNLRQRQRLRHADRRQDRCSSRCRTQRRAATPRRGATTHFAEAQAWRHAARAARHRFPARHRRRRPCRGRPVRQYGRHRHQPAGQEHRHRLPQDRAAGEPASGGST